MSYTTLTAVEDLKDGDLVDLEGDKYADPEHSDPYLEADYSEVWGEPERDWAEEYPKHPDDTTIVNFNWPGQVGFPRSWQVRKVVE